MPQDIANILDVLAQNQFSKEELVALIADQIRQNFKIGTEEFYRLLYRLDIDERKALESAQTENPEEEIAKVIIERQIKKMQTRREYSANQAPWIDLDE